MVDRYMDKKVRCPICDSSAESRYFVAGSVVRQEMQEYYGELVPETIHISDYQVMRCKQCFLEFADPLMSGDSHLQDWLASQSCYYTSNRWEWFVVLDYIKAAGRRRHLDILEIGCGSGDFLQLAQRALGVAIVGLDTSPAAIKAAKSRGLDAFCGSIESFQASKGEGHRKKFDICVAFHCLEHVDDPKALLTSTTKMLKPYGRVFYSVPNSPMSFEARWFDPMNNPPHHMTRWNGSSLKALADACGLRISLVTPRARSVLHRSLQALKLSWYGPKSSVSRRCLLSRCLRHPTALLKECIAQWRRPRVGGQTVGNVILAEFWSGTPDQTASCGGCQ